MTSFHALRSVRGKSPTGGSRTLEAGIEDEIFKPMMVGSLPFRDVGIDPDEDRNGDLSVNAPTVPTTSLHS